MPLYKAWSPDAHSLAAIWHIEEEEAFFRQAVNITSAIRHPRKGIEHLAGRYLLQHLKEGFPLHHIAPDAHDKPRLPENQYFFSISHSYPYVAAAIADTEECGIDIQTWHPRIQGIAHMFLSEAEQALCREDARLLILAWCAKEAAYKWYGRRGTDFIRDLPIQAITPKKEIFFPHAAEEDYIVNMYCFGLSVRPDVLMHKDFSLACLIQKRIGTNK